VKYTVAILGLMAAGLLAVVFTGYDFQRASALEISDQWGRLQLAQAEEVTQSIKEYVRGNSRGMMVLSSVISRHYGDLALMGADVRAYFGTLEEPNVRAISVYDRAGTIIYSDSAGAVGRNDAKRDFFAWARQPVNNGRLFVSPVRRTPAEEKNPPEFGAVLVTPLYDGTAQAERFLGCLSLTVDLRSLLGLQGGHLDATKAAGRRWVISEDGSLLFHSEHPEMVGHSIRNRSQACGQCHSPTADAAEVILARKRGTMEYGLTGQSRKLAAFAPLEFENARWIVVVTTPLEEITRFTRKAYRESLIFLALVVLEFVAGATLLFLNYRSKAKAQEEARQWRNKQALADAERRYEDRYHTIIETAHDVIWTLDRQGLFTFCNRRAEELSGYTTSELLENSFVSVFHPEDLPTFESLIAEVLAGTPRTYEVQVHGKGGRILTLAVNSVPLYEDQAVVGTVSFGRDVTGQRQAEEENRALQAQILQVQKMESVGRLAGGVAHDFNNMLTVIVGHTGLVLARLDPESPLREYLKTIEDAAERSADLTRRLLGFARMQVISPKVLDLNVTISDMLKMLRPLIGENIALTWIPGVDLWPVKVDSSQIDQILTNMVVNGRDAIAGAGSVTIKTANVELDEAYCESHAGCAAGQYVVLAVSDSGGGIDEDTLSHIFEPFFTTKPAGKGTGLGLATVYGIVKQNNGFLDVSSQLGRGTTFRIYLPRSEAEVVEQPHSVDRKATGESPSVMTAAADPAS
jgi:PAS domain S-box-containing protein